MNTRREVRGQTEDRANRKINIAGDDHHCFADREDHEDRRRQQVANPSELNKKAGFLIVVTVITRRRAIRWSCEAFANPPIREEKVVRA